MEKDEKDKKNKKDKSLNVYTWNRDTEEIKTASPKYVNMALESIDSDQCFTVTTRKYTHMVYDDLVNVFADPDDPYANGLKTEEHYKLFMESTYGLLTVENGAMRLQKP